VKEEMGGQLYCTACEFADRGEPAVSAVFDPPASEWKPGDIVTITDETGITRCRVEESTIVTENNELVRSLVAVEVGESNDSG
jgi:hypothetical protein